MASAQLHPEAQSASRSHLHTCQGDNLFPCRSWVFLAGRNSHVTTIHNPFRTERRRSNLVRPLALVVLCRPRSHMISATTLRWSWSYRNDLDCSQVTAGVFHPFLSNIWTYLDNSRTWNVKNPNACYIMLLILEGSSQVSCLQSFWTCWFRAGSSVAQASAAICHLEGRLRSCLVIWTKGHSKMYGHCHHCLHTYGIRW